MVNKRQKIEKGFSIIEMMIYLSLFAFITATSVLTSYQLSSANQNLGLEISLLEEAEFILGKINWLISDNQEIIKPISNTGSEILSVKKEGLDFLVYLNNGFVLIESNGEVYELNSGDFEFKNLFFENFDLLEGSKVSGLRASFEIDDQKFETVKFDYEI